MSSFKPQRSHRLALRPGLEYEFERLTLSRELSRNVVTRLLTDRAEYGGWELDRVRILPDGTRKVVLRRKIIRQRPAYVA
jgi:Family of unknown function (DUF5703)